MTTVSLRAPVVPRPEAGNPGRVAGFGGIAVAARRDVARQHGPARGALAIATIHADDPRVGIVSREQHEASLADLCAGIRSPHDGILGPTSLAWRLGGDLGVFLGGGRAALLQLAHPMVAHAIDHHSRTRADVVGRFQRTFDHVFAMVFGDLDAAIASARRVHAIHGRISGVMRGPLGGWPDGTRYHANDEHALFWVHSTLTDTTIRVRELLDGALPLEVKDRYVVELHRFAALFGIPRALLPTCWHDHVRSVRSMLDSDLLVVTPAAREMGRFLFGHGAPTQPVLGRVTEAVTAELMPPRLAAAFGLRRSPRLVAGALAAFRSVYARVPRSAVRIPAHAAAQHRIRGFAPPRLGTWTERRLFELARRVAGDAPVSDTNRGRDRTA